MASVTGYIGGTVIKMDPKCWALANHPSHAGTVMGDRPRWIENGYSLIDVPGEWYFDESTAVLYYKRRPGENLATAEVIVPVREALLRVAGGQTTPVRNVILRGLTFAHATWLYPSSPLGYPAAQFGAYLVDAPSPPWYADTRLTPGAVVLSHAEDCVIERNVFEHLGQVGLVVADGSSRNWIEGNVFRDISSAALRVGDATDHTAQAHDNVVRNSFIRDVANEFLDAPAILVPFARGSRIDHNEIRATPQTGIGVGWEWEGRPTFAYNNVITSNVVGPSMSHLEDGGGIYTAGIQDMSGIAQNFVLGQVKVYGGLYLDQATQYFSVFDNVVSSAPYWYLVRPGAPNVPPARDNAVYHNFADTPSEYCFGCESWGNLIYDNTVVAPGQWPRRAREIVAQAGLEPAFADLRDADTYVEAEAYRHGGQGVGYSDSTPANHGGAYRQDGVDIYPGVDWYSGAYTVGGTATGEWLGYSIHTPAPGNFTFSFRVSTLNTGNAIRLLIDGQDKGTVTLPNTQGWLNFVNAPLQGVRLARGPHEVRLELTGGFALDAFSFTRTAPSCNVAGPPTLTLAGHFDDAPGQDTMGIYQGAACWQMNGAGGPEVWLTGWGIGRSNVVGDYDGDGRSDVLLILNDGQWRWHLAESIGSGFVAYPNATTDVWDGYGACARNIDADPADEVVVVSTPSLCANLDTATHSFVVEFCNQTCP